jgi:hypothetical protein
MLPVRNIMGLGAKVVRSTADDLARLTKPKVQTPTAFGLRRR